MNKALWAALVIVLLAGCSTQRFDVNAPIGPDGQPTLENSQPFFVGGIGQEQEVNAAEVCGGADLVASVETEQTFLDGLLGFLSGNIYTPRTARVYCLLEVQPG